MLYHWIDRFKWPTKPLIVAVLNGYLMVINDESKEAILKFGATHREVYQASEFYSAPLVQGSCWH